RPRPPVSSSRGGAAVWQIDRELAGRIKAIAETERVTPYMVLLAAFQVLLGRYTGMDDFLIGAPCAGRSRAGFERGIGYFINMLPVRADLSGDPSFRVVLRRLGTTMLEGLEHQDYPFSLIVQRMGVERDPSRAPLVQASFTQESVNRSAKLASWRFFQ